MSEARRREMREQRRHEPGARITPRGVRVASYTNPRVDEWTHQPRPHGSLVIDRVARRRIAFVPRRVTRFAGRERPQAERCQELLLDGINDARCPFTIDERDRQSADRE